MLGEEGVVGINRINKAGTRRWGNQMAGNRFDNGGNLLCGLTKPGFSLVRQGINTQTSAFQLGDAEAAGVAQASSPVPTLRGRGGSSYRRGGSDSGT